MLAPFCHKWLAISSLPEAHQDDTARRQQDHEAQRAKGHEQHLVVMGVFVVDETIERHEIGKLELCRRADDRCKEAKRIGEGRLERPVGGGTDLQCRPHNLRADKCARSERVKWM